VSTVLGLDHGTRRIGVAVGDTETGLAFARPALRRSSLARDVEALVSLARSEEADVAALGLPRNMDGSEGAQAASVRDFGEALLAAGLEVVYVDERLSSWQAAGELAATGRRPHRSSGELDSAAARIILQEYLDSTRSPGEPPSEESA
jgi:putative Holliday junction resolvase